MKPLHIVGVIALLALIIGGFYVSGNKPTPSQKNSDGKTVVSNEQSITVYREYGEMSWKDIGVSSYVKITENKVTIPNHASVKTGNGRGYVMFPDNSSIALSSSTEIEISYDPKKTSIMQLIGTTYHRVKSLASGNQYEVRTPNTLAAIRGTKLAVTYNPAVKKTWVAVTEHTVSVTPLKDDGNMKESPVMVGEGNMALVNNQATSTKAPSVAEVNGGGSITIQKNNDVAEMKALLDENRVIDRQYDKESDAGKKDFMEKMITVLQKEDQSSDTKTRTEVILKALNTVELESVPEQKTNTAPKAGTLKPTDTTAPKPTVKTDTEIIKAPIVKEPVDTTRLKVFPTNNENPSQEELNFSDNFYSEYERLFSADDPSSYCKSISGMTAADMVTKLKAISNTAGYIIPNTTELTSFASDLITACKDGSISSRAAAFKTRFDTAYSY